MKEKIDYLSTLFVGIDIASRIHVISALDFNQDFFIKMKPVQNTQEGAALIESMIVDVPSCPCKSFRNGKPSMTTPFLSVMARPS